MGALLIRSVVLGFLWVAGQGALMAQDGEKGQPEQNKESSASVADHCVTLAESGMARENQLMEMITAGERDFLLPRKDGYLYPVKVKDDAFMESIPVKVWVTQLSSDKTTTAEVVQLQLLKSAQGLSAEMSEDGAEWSAVTDGHWYGGRFLGRAGDAQTWQAYDPGHLRFKTK